MELSPVVCVSQTVGKKTRSVGIYTSPRASADPDQSYVVLPNRTDGFPFYLSLEDLEKLLIQEGMADLLNMVHREMANARLGFTTSQRRKMTSADMLKQLARRLGITEPI